MIIGRKH